MVMLLWNISILCEKKTYQSPYIRLHTQKKGLGWGSLLKTPIYLHQLLPA